jgi:hypothetical protein
MLAGMTGQQLTEWMEYARLEPFGEQRADLRMGILAAQITNVMTRQKQSDPMAKYEDFMPKFEEAELEPDQDTVARKIDAYFSALANRS